MSHKDVEIDVLIGKTLESIDGLSVGNDNVYFKVSDVESYQMYHDQDCCEHVVIDDVVGEVDDLVGTPILMAEESTNRDDPDRECSESCTWTFYKLATAKGYVTIKWLGTSNGYYSESVSFRRANSD